MMSSLLMSGQRQCGGGVVVSWVSSLCHNNMDERNITIHARTVSWCTDWFLAFCIPTEVFSFLHTYRGF